MTASTAPRFFPFLSVAEERALLDASESKTVVPNEVAVEQGEKLRAIFVIEAGTVRVEHQDRGAMVPLAVLGTGEFFGEMSFVDGEPASARVVAEEPTKLRIIDAIAVERLNAADRSFGERLYRSIAAILARRLRLTSLRVHPDQSWG
jgi:CRP-like cAMP-binding protein